MRFYDVNGGSIKVSGTDIRDVTRASLRGSYGMVLQDTWLRAGTVRENIAYGKPGATAEEIAEAARRANIDAFIESLPQGYNTVVGERGSRLSGGQKQRISIARALAKHSPILVLDDSTSALDMETEHEIQQTLNALRDTTKIIIAHRISAVRHADEIIYLADGKIAERGTHEELLAKKGLYYDTYMAQYGALAMSSASAGEPAPAACC